MTLLLAAMLAAPTAEAGFYSKDRYDPPSPGLLSRSFRSTLRMGPHWTRDVYHENTRRISLAGDLEMLFAVAPFVTVGGRAGFEHTSARVRAVSNAEEWTGYRTFGVALDPVVSLGGNWGRIYGFRSIFAPTRLYGLSGSRWPRVGANMMHFGGGIELLWGGELTVTGGDSGGVQLEYRQTRMSLDEPVGYVPSSAVGHTFYVSFVGFSFGGGR